MFDLLSQDMISHTLKNNLVLVKSHHKPMEHYHLSSTGSISESILICRVLLSHYTLACRSRCTLKSLYASDICIVLWWCPEQAILASTAELWAIRIRASLRISYRNLSCGRNVTYNLVLILEAKSSYGEWYEIKGLWNKCYEKSVYGINRVLLF